MKNILKLIILFLLLMPFGIKASNISGYITENDTLIASGPNLEKPNNSCLSSTNKQVYAAPGKLHCLDNGEKVSILNYESIIQSTLQSCKKGFYKVSFTTAKGNTYNGYVCGDKIVTNVDTSAYAEEFRNANIPESYWDKLTLLKNKYPNWKFVGYNTNLDWNEVTINESVVNYDEEKQKAYGINYIQKNNPALLSLAKGSYNPETNTYNVLEAGGWYAANKDTVAYYMDPRNFLDEKNIFMFENLGYNKSYQTIDVINKIFENTPLKDYANYYIAAAEYDGNKVSPIMLAARSKQEVIGKDGKLTNAANGSAGVYNFYNLGAFSTCDNPVQCAIEFAGGYNGEYKSYNRPWTTAEAAILNGAKYLAERYINVSQNTLYFQKFNVTSNTYGNYSHQYMNNIEAPISEANSTYSSYSKIDGLLNGTIEFIIPFYNNMPSSAATLPTSVDEKAKNELKNEEKQTNTADVLNKSGYAINSNFITNVVINDTASNMISRFKSAGASDIKIYKDGALITGGETLATADIVKVKINNEEITYRIVVYGDANGDGRITAVDYVKIKNAIMGQSGLVGSYKEAADANRDGRISAVDYVNVKNYIMGNNSTLR